MQAQIWAYWVLKSNEHNAGIVGKISSAHHHAAHSRKLFYTHTVLSHNC